MHEYPTTIDHLSEFESIVTAEDFAALGQFEANLDQIDTSIDDKTEAGLATVTMGKMVGCQDTGGGGHEWEKLA